MQATGAQANLDRVFSALADPTRRSILQRLGKGTHSVGMLAQPYAMSLPAISRHLRVLEAAGLLVRRRVGRTTECDLAPEALMTAAEWIGGYREFWRQRLDALDRLLRTRTEGDQE